MGAGVIGELTTEILVDLVGVQAMYGYVAGLGVLVVGFSLAISKTATGDVQAEARVGG